MQASGSVPLVASVIRRTANLPSGSCAGTAGARSGHQVTTGVSGSRNGVTTLLAWLASGPDNRSTTTSLAPASRPTRSWASSRGSVVNRSPGITTITRHGCSRLAALAASIDSSSRASESGAMTSVSTRPRVIAPPSSRIATIFLLIAPVLVSGRSTITAASIRARTGAASRTPTPGPTFRPHTDRAYRASPSIRARDPRSSKTIRPRR
nr:hypothetical protein CPGR_03719 [Mycolicibacterium fortuitum subsp. fortuitum DSM 46621 = ATCC 6841 = JCM 6387]